MDREERLMQRQQSHATGTFPVCRHCQHEPRHILDARRRPAGGHLMSCACGDTRKHDDLAAALIEWRTLHAPEPALIFRGAEERTGRVMTFPKRRPS